MVNMTIILLLICVWCAFQTRRKPPAKKRKAGDLDDLKQELDIDFHKVTPEELYQRFQTHPENVRYMPFNLPWSALLGGLFRMYVWLILFLFRALVTQKRKRTWKGTVQMHSPRQNRRPNGWSFVRICLVASRYYCGLVLFYALLPTEFRSVCLERDASSIFNRHDPLKIISNLAPWDAIYALLFENLW